MPADSTKTKADIITSAKKEFLAHGFVNASMRQIAAGAGVTTGALYRHFTDKEALFYTLTEPAYEGFIELMGNSLETHKDNLRREGLCSIWENSGWSVAVMVEYIYDNFEAFLLLLTCAEQTGYENYIHRMIDIDIDLTLNYMEEAKKQGYQVAQLSYQEMHMLVNAQYSALFELVLHKIPKEQALKYVKTISRFFTCGWQEIFMNEEP